MELELMNIFHLYNNNHCTIIRANMTKKQLAEELKEYAKDNDTFRPVKFKDRMVKKGYRFYYEQS